ncbi:MAG: TonB-dependent receptor [Chitinophagales bacterium]
MIFLFFSLQVFSQESVIKGKIVDGLNNDPIPFANIVIQNTSNGTSADVNGEYILDGIKPGLYNLVVSSLGYESKVIYEVEVTKSKSRILNIELTESTNKLEEVEVKASPFDRKAESPVSVKSIGVNEIQRYPGGNRDISKVIQSLPGVSSTVAFRNDIVIRGGSPNENRFYLDGIEVPVINHFSTQGASGGPIGLINVDFIKDVELYTGAFPANRGNMLSSLLEFSLIDGRNDRLSGRFTLGSSEAGFSLQGPIGNKSTFIVSVRRSYLQLLFKAFGLPFLPTYNDFQFKYKYKTGKRSDLTVLGLGAIDDLKLNLSENETDDQKFLLGSLPENKQWNYTVGARYRKFLDNGVFTLVASRNHLYNQAIKYENNDDSDPDNLTLNYESQESENKLRAEHTVQKSGYKINYGVGYEFAQYRNETFNLLTLPFGNVRLDFESKLNLHKYSFFAQVSKSYFKDRLSLSLGIRGDGMDYTPETSNPFKQLSPRFSASVSITDRLSFNFNTGHYYQLPAYTVLGFADNEGELVNKDNGIGYISSTHVVGGFQYNTSFNAQFSVEGFFKKYDDYPFQLTDSVSLANLGGDFGVVGNRPAAPISEGRAYGVEFFYQQKLFKGFFGIVAYTYVRSEFTDKNGEYRPSSWDNRHLLSLTFGKKFKRDWEIGMRWRVIGGAPYTPFDIELSSQKLVWDQNGVGIPDYDRTNSERLNVSHQMDIRVDKKYFFKKWSLNLYLDIQNVYNQQNQLQPILFPRLDENDNPIVENPDAPVQQQRYSTRFLENEVGSILPTIGVIVEF